MNGLAPARIGMTLDDLQAAGGPLKVPENVDPASCFYVSRAEQPGVLFMMVDGTLQRIDVRGGTTTTDTGVRIGDDVARGDRHVQQQRGRVRSLARRERQQRLLAGHGQRKQAAFDEAASLLLLLQWVHADQMYRWQ